MFATSRVQQPGLLIRILLAAALGVAGLLLSPPARAQAAPRCILWIFCRADATPASAPVAQAADPALPVPLAEVAGADTVMLGLINNERTAAGLVPLALRDDLNAFASAHAKAMAEHGEIYHSDEFFTAATKRRFGARRVGENVARHSALQAAHLLLMDSPGHRANILDPGFRVVGLASWTNSGRFFVSQNFIEPSGATHSGAAAPATTAAPPTTAAPAPKPAAAPRATTTAAAAPPAPPVEAPAVPAAAPAEPEVPAEPGPAAEDGQPRPPAQESVAGKPASTTDTQISWPIGLAAASLLTSLLAGAAMAALRRRRQSGS